jgi:hypothetical protein
MWISKANAVLAVAKIEKNTIRATSLVVEIAK